MATAGPRYPGTVATEVGPSGDNDWLTASNVGADDGSEAQITAATYDAADHSYRLKATNFGFDADVPAGSTINGITVEIDRRAFAGAAQDQEVRLYDSTATLVGTDKQTATAWPATLGIATYGGAADTWASGLDAADIRSAGFGVALIVLADAANTDIGVDFIRVTVDYTDTSVTVTPGVASLVTATFAPTVSATQNQLLTPGVTALTLSTFAPVVTATDHQTVTPDTASLVLTAFAPTVTGGAGTTVTPAVAELVLTPFAPTVTTSDHQTVTPGVASLAMTAFAPNVVLTDHKLVTPSAASLALATFAPAVSVGGPQTVTPGPLALTLTTYAPTVTGDQQEEAAEAIGPSARGAAAVAAFAPSPAAAVASVTSRVGRGPTYRPWVKRMYPPPDEEVFDEDDLIALLL